MEGRIRFCLSAAHTKEQLDYVSTIYQIEIFIILIIITFQVLSHIEDIVDMLGLKYSRKPRSTTKIEYSDSETE